MIMIVDSREHHPRIRRNPDGEYFIMARPRCQKVNDGCWEVVR